MGNKAEGRAQAAIKDAEARQRAVVLTAEAEADRQRIEAEGLQTAIKAVSDVIFKQGQQLDGSKENSVEAAVQFLTVLRFLEPQAKFSDSANSKIIMLPSKDSLPLTYGGLKFLMD